MGETSLRMGSRIRSHIQQGIISGIMKHTEACVDFKIKYEAYCMDNNAMKSSKENLALFLGSFFKVRKKCKTNIERRWHECLIIKKQSPILNSRDEYLPQIIL